MTRKLHVKLETYIFKILTLLKSCNRHCLSVKPELDKLICHKVVPVMLHLKFKLISQEYYYVRLHKLQ